ncbi:hypothetical protein MMC16_005456 [Acarospora aff. strigata]|nr:hypothetical protein [Acarospora aff. strigata]
MTTPNADIATKVSTKGGILIVRMPSGTNSHLLTRLLVLSLAAEIFVESYYTALRSSRATLSTFYSPPSAMPDGKPLPAIIFNGNVISDAAAFQEMFEKQMPPSHYEVQSYDCHTLNPNYTAKDIKSSSGGSGKNMTILLTVSGYVKFGELREAEMKGFSETFVLVPSSDPTGSKGQPRRNQEWLIQSQNFRLIV